MLNNIIKIGELIKIINSNISQNEALNKLLELRDLLSKDNGPMNEYLEKIKEDINPLIVNSDCKLWKKIKNTRMAGAIITYRTKILPLVSDTEFYFIKNYSIQGKNPSQISQITQLPLERIYDILEKIGYKGNGNKKSASEIIFRNTYTKDHDKLYKGRKYD